VQLGCNECLQTEESTNLRSQKFQKFNSLGFLHILCQIKSSESNKLRVSRICTTYYVPTAMVAKFSRVKNRKHHFLEKSIIMPIVGRPWRENRGSDLVIEISRGPQNIVDHELRNVLFQFGKRSRDDEKTSESRYFWGR
jgi:hypothetical protein